MNAIQSTLTQAPTLSNQLAALKPASTQWKGTLEGNRDIAGKVN